jgi:L-fucose isomerase-like protein
LFSGNEEYRMTRASTQSTMATTDPASNLPAPTKPLGLLIIGRKRAGFDQEWNLIQRRKSLAALKELGIEVVTAAEPVVDDQTTIAAIDQIRNAGCDTLLVLQPSLGNGQLAFTLMQRWDKPVVLWATPERPEGEKVSSCSLVAQHLWASLFRLSQRSFEFVYGNPDDAEVRASLRRSVLVAQVPAELRRTKIGLVGSNAPGFVAMHADPFALNKLLGVQLHTLSLPMFMDRATQIDESRVKEDVRKVKELGWPTKDASETDLPLNSRFYLAMHDLIAEERLDAIALQCWPELGNMMGQWPYLAQTRLTNEGVINSMEGDVDGALTCLIGKQLGAGVGFITDWLEHDKDTIHFWHPGVAPLPMIDSPTLANHFNIAKPFVVEGPLKPGMAVTVARLWRCDNRYHLTAFEARSIKARRQLTGNAGFVQVEGFDVRKWFNNALHAGLPHHVVVFAGNHAEAFRSAARVAKAEWHELA